VPEILEIEYYRLGAVPALRRTVESVGADDAWYLKRDTSAAELDAALVGERFVDARRHGKVLLLDVSSGVTAGLRFGMTGRLIVDDDAPIRELEYSSARDDPAWDRFVVHFADGGSLRMRDPRRLGGVELDPDIARLGPDAWELTAVELEAATAGSSVAIKARLLDQNRVAGLGNLLVDETLWRAGIAPGRSADDLTRSEIDTLATTVRSTIADLFARGGSHRGDLHDERAVDGRCPLDGAALRRDTIGGRTSYWCPQHQR